MIYASDTNHHLIRAEPGKIAYCPDCNEQLIPKCGQIITHHWAHKSTSDCDTQYEPVSQWHLNWQNQIENPIGGVNIEVPIVKSQKYKRADLVSKNGLIIEFQKSPISLEEVNTREKFYKKMIWVVHQDIAKSKVWNMKDADMVVFAEKGDYLVSNDYIFSKEEFIKKVINSDYFDIDMIRKEYRKRLFFLFDYYIKSIELYSTYNERLRLEIEKERKMESERQMREKLRVRNDYIQSLSNLQKIREEYQKYVDNQIKLIETQISDHYKNVEEIIEVNKKFPFWKDNHVQKKLRISNKVKVRDRRIKRNGRVFYR